MLEKQERAANGEIDEEEDAPAPASTTATAAAPAVPAAGKSEVGVAIDRGVCVFGSLTVRAPHLQCWKPSFDP